MIASGSSYYGVVRFWDKRQSKCLQVGTVAVQRCDVYVNAVVTSCCVCVSPSSCALTLWPAPCTAWGSAALTCTQPWPTRWRLWTSARASSKSRTHRDRPCVQNSSDSWIFGNDVFSSFCICPPELDWSGWGSLRSFTFYWCLPWYWYFTFLSLENPGQGSNSIFIDRSLNILQFILSVQDLLLSLGVSVVQPTPLGATVKCNRSINCEMDHLETTISVIKVFRSWLLSGLLHLLPLVGQVQQLLPSICDWDRVISMFQMGFFYYYLE